jgi:homoserine dehydrogenase
VNPLRIWLVGFGMVGSWLASALDAQGEWLADRYGRSVTVVGIGNAWDGFACNADGLELGSVLAAVPGGRPVTDQPGAGSLMPNPEIPVKKLAPNAATTGA